MPTIDIAINHAPHRLTIERDVLSRAGELVRDVAPHDRALLVADRAIRHTHAAVVEQSLSDAGYETRTIELDADERKKTLETVRTLYASLLALRSERTSPVIAVGGGVIGDIAGFAAATYLRGVPIVQVPTTLLAMVDAAIGGKTAVNHPLPGGELGKNLIGAFWQPAAILADPAILQSLDDRDLRCGIAECIKHALLVQNVQTSKRPDVQSGALDALLREHAQSILDRDVRALEELIAQSAAIKIGIVEADEREAGTRMLLNLGHTFAHAIEPIEELDVRHGEAVAIGLCAAARCAVITDRLTEQEANEIDALVVRYELPNRLPQPVPIDRVMRLMQFDKKTASGTIRLILPASGGGIDIVSNVPAKAIRTTWMALGAAER